MGPLKRMPWWMHGLLGSHIRGITLPPFGMYLRAGHEENARLRAHELVHWAQYERMGLMRFYATYLWQWMRYGTAQHPMEVEARSKSGVA